MRTQISRLPAALQKIVRKTAFDLSRSAYESERERLALLAAKEIALGASPAEVMVRIQNIGGKALLRGKSDAGGLDDS